MAFAIPIPVAALFTHFTDVRTHLADTFPSRTGFAVAAFMALFLNLVLPEEIEDETRSITANDADAADDREEWARIKHGKMAEDGSENEEKVKEVEASAARS